jgi:hypothetical protein
MDIIRAGASGNIRHGRHGTRVEEGYSGRPGSVPEEEEFLQKGWETLEARLSVVWASRKRKNQLIAAMANYLKLDVYDLELSGVDSNANLMMSLRNTSNRSILVVEDIDCNREVRDRAEEVGHHHPVDPTFSKVGVSRKHASFKLQTTLWLKLNFYMLSNAR